MNKAFVALRNKAFVALRNVCTPARHFSLVSFRGTRLLAHRVSRPRGTGSVGDSVGEGAQA